MAKHKPYKYAGVLRTPIYSNLALASALQPEDKSLKERAAADREQQCLRRIEALVKNCDADLQDPQWGWKVALTLAKRHVPGFSFTNDPPRRGRPKWKAGSDLPLVIAMAKRIDNGHSIRRAAELVATERRKGESAKALDRRYRRFEERTKEFEAEARWMSANYLAGPRRGN